MRYVLLNLMDSKRDQRLRIPTLWNTNTKQYTRIYIYISKSTRIYERESEKYI
jgi:hypothetical protein